MDDMLARLNRIYPNSSYVLIPKYNPDQWKDRKYDSAFDTKGAMNKWKSTPLSYEKAQEAVEKGFRIGWVVPKNMCVIDIDNHDNPESQEYVEKILEKFEVKYSYNYTSRGIHLLFQDPTGNIKSDSHCKCALNIDVDSRANATGYIILPCNDPHREWGKWNDFVEDVPYFLIPLLKDNTPSFIGMQDGDGRNNALFIWRTKIEQTNKLQKKQIENSIRTINEYLFATPMPNNELFKTVLREKGSKEKKNKHDKENPLNKLAEEIVSKYDIISFGDKMYKFNGTYYREMDYVEVERLIHLEVNKNLSHAARKEVIQFVSLKTQVGKDDFNKDWYKIACESGILNLVTGDLTMPTKMDINTIYIPWKYNPDPVYSPRIDEFMKQLCNGDVIKMQFLYQVVGYCLLKKNLFEKFFIFQGGGGTGKSTFANLILKLINDDVNASHVGLNEMDNDYYLSTMIDKLVNIDDDTVDNKALNDTGRFKSITSGNKIAVRQIFNPVFTFKPFVTLIFCSNKMPKMMDRTSGLYRRMVLVELNNKVQNPDPLFMLKITDTDMEYFLFKSVEAIKVALEEGHFRITNSQENLLQKFKCRQSPINEWIYEEDYCLGDIVNKRCMPLYAKFTNWCQENGHQKIMTLLSFKEEICAIFDCELGFELKDNKKRTNITIFTKRGQIDEEWRPFQ